MTIGPCLSEAYVLVGQLCNEGLVHQIVWVIDPEEVPPATYPLSSYRI
jgi:hypothetical protein